MMPKIDKTFTIVASIFLIYVIFFSFVVIKATGKEDRFRITGMVTNISEGYVNFSITSEVAVSLTVSAIDFGSGYVGQGCNNCTMDTQGRNNSPSCCVNFLSNQTGFVLENTGNRAVSLDANFSKNASSFIGGTTNVVKFMIYLAQDEPQSCATLGATWSSGYANVPTYNTGESAGLICDILTPDNGNDTIRIHVNLTIPDNAPSGVKTSNLTIVGTG